MSPLTRMYFFFGVISLNLFEIDFVSALLLKNLLEYFDGTW